MRSGGEWISFRGVTSAQMGVRVLRLPRRVRARARGQKVSVPGRSGELWIPDGGLEDIRLSALLRLPADKQTEVASWLCGGGLLGCSDRPDVCLRARVSGELEFDYAGPGRRFCVAEARFDAEPYAYAYPNELLTLSAPGILLNPGTADAEPRITVYGAGDIALLIGGKTLLLSNIDAQIVLDSEAKLAYKNTTLLTHKLTGDWPLIPPGAAMVSWTGNVSKLEIEPNWRYL